MSEREPADPGRQIAFASAASRPVGRLARTYSRTAGNSDRRTSGQGKPQKSCSYLRGTPCLPDRGLGRSRPAKRPRLAPRAAGHPENRRETAQGSDFRGCPCLGAGRDSTALLEALKALSRFRTPRLALLIHANWELSDGCSGKPPFDS